MQLEKPHLFIVSSSPTRDLVQSFRAQIPSFNNQRNSSANIRLIHSHYTFYTTSCFRLKTITPRSLSNMIRPRDLVSWLDWCPVCQRYVTFYTWRCYYSHRSSFHCRHCGEDVSICVCERRRRRARRRRSGRFRIQVYS